MHVVSRVLPRPDTNCALVHGRLAAGDALLPFRKDDEHHLCLRNPLCDPARIQRDLDVVMVLPPQVAVQSPTCHFFSRILGVDNLHQAQNLGLNRRPHRNKPAIWRRIRAQVTVRSLRDLLPCSLQVPVRKEHVPEARLAQHFPDHSVRLARQPGKRHLRCSIVYVELILALLTQLSLVVPQHRLFDLALRPDEPPLDPGILASRIPNPGSHIVHQRRGNCSEVPPDPFADHCFT